MKKILILIIIFILSLISVNGYTTNDIFFGASFDDVSSDNNTIYEFTGFHNGTNAGALRKTGSDCFLGDCYSYSNDYINFTNNIFSVAQNKITIVIWYKNNQVCNADYEQLLGSSTTGTGDFWLEIAPEFNEAYKSRMIYRVAGAGQPVMQLLPGEEFCNKVGWNMLITTFDSTTGNATVYLNTTSRLSEIDQTFTAPIQTDDLVIGAKKESGTIVQYFDGLIDEVIFFNKTLDRVERQTLYDNYLLGISPLSSPQPPTIYFLNETPINNTNININTTLYFNLTGSTPIDCYFYINDTLKNYLISLNEGIFNFTFDSSIWLEGYNKLNITCNNSVGSDTDLKYLFVDTINPVINYAQMIQGSNGISFNINGSTIDENLIHNISVSDNNLYSINITWYWKTDPTDIEFTEKILGLNGTNYIYNKTASIGLFDENDFNYSLFIEVCDAHTDLNLRDLPITEIDKSKIIDDITIKENTLGVIDTTTTKLKDRYIFDYTVDKEINEFKLDIESPYYIDIIKNSKDLGHMVTGRKWIDFNNDIGATVELVRVNDYKVTAIITAKNPTNYFKFNSIGEINCINQTLDAEIQIEDGFTNASTPEDNTQFIVYNTNKLINFSYYAYYIVAPDNCSLLINGTINQTDFTITKNIEQFFNNINFSYPLEQQTYYYNWRVQCNDLHLHPPDYTETHTTQTELRTFTIFNNATTTTTTTTTTNEEVTTTTLRPIQTALINCSFNAYPYLKEKLPLSERDLIKWFCTFNSSTPKQCITLIKRGDDLVQTNPSRETIDQLGIIDYFEGSGYVNAYFDSKDLIPNFKYNFTISCYDTFRNFTITNTAEIQPTNKPLYDYTVPRINYFVTGATALILIIILIGLIIFIKRKVLRQ